MSRLILQRGDPNNQHEEGADEREELVKLVQGAPIHQLVEDEGNKPAENREHKAPFEPTRRKVVSPFDRVTDRNCD